VIITCTLLAFGQDNKPSGLINLISPNNPTFDYSTSDSTIGIWKGTYKWNKLFSAKQIQHKVDSLATANSDTLDYYKLKTDSIAKTGYVPVDRYNKGLATKVPYTGATLNVDLGNYSITAKGQNLPISNGACVIPTITDNGNGSVTIGSGDYHLASDAAGHDSKTYTLTGGLFTIIDGSQNYIVADYNSGTPLVKLTTDVSIINETTVVPIYSIFRNGNYLHTQNWDALGLALANKVHQSIVKTQRYRRESGLSFSEYGTRNISVEQGRIWTGAVPITLDAVNTATDNLFVWYHSGGNWTSSVQTQYNNTQYDNGTNLATLTSNRFAVNWVFRGVESQKYVYIVLGTGDYTESQSIAATLPSIPTAISSHSVLIGKIIVQKNAATAFSKQSAFDTQFGLSPIQNHGDLTGRDATDSHPASAITNTPYSTTSATTIQLAINELTDEKEPTLTKGNLTAASTKVAVTGGTGAVIGSGTTVDVSEANLTLSNIGGSVTDSQVPNTITLDNITQVTNRSHTNLTHDNT